MAVYTQYSNATNLNNFLYGTNTYKGLSQLLNVSVDDFYNNFFDIDTATGDGLTNWGYILDLPNGYAIPDYHNAFGFGDTMGLATQLDGTYPENFNHGGFYGGLTTLHEFSDDQYRLLLKLKYNILTSNYSYGDIITIMNKFIQNIDPSFKFRLIQNGTKDIIYSFNATFTEETQVFRQILEDAYLLPVPMGVKYSVVFEDF